ncbi:uncharacterized protein LOC105736119 [Apis florea]|uniref:uncharacterized protein LOC105736119 n=1 Tax=Apis florea TaxID=7463 RepID=UPI00062957E2|nr:uncharacterized protein LOC105736119 [Apis florea]
MKSYEAATRIIIVLSYATSFRYYEKEKNLSKFLLSWIYNIVSFVTFVYFMSCLEMHNLSGMPYNKERITYTFLLFIFVYGYIIIIITGWCKSKDVIALRKRIDQVDENLKEIGIEIEYQSVYRKVKITGLIWLIHSIVLIGLFLNSIKYKRNISEIITSFSYIYIINLESFALYDYDILVHWLRLRFEQTNELLETILSDRGKMEKGSKEDAILLSPNFRNRSRSNDSWSFQRSLHGCQVFPVNHVPASRQGLGEKVRLVRQIRSAQLQLSNVSKMMNNVYNVQLLTCTFIIMIYIIIDAYYIYEEIKRMIGVKKLLEMSILCIWNSFGSFMKVVYLAYYCECAINEAKRTINIIHLCPLDEKDIELRNEFLQFFFQISYTQLEESKTIDYKINYCYIRHCISFMLSYVIIMIQWSQNSSIKHHVSMENVTSYNLSNVQTTTNQSWIDVRT